MIIVVLHDQGKAEEFKQILTAAGYAYSTFVNLHTLIKVEADEATFTLKDHPLVKAIDGEPDKRTPIKPLAVTVPENGINHKPYTYDISHGSWPRARICRRKNPFRRSAPHTLKDTSYVYTRTGVGVDVYILDVGVAPSHPEFEGRLTDYSGSFTDVLSEPGNNHGTLSASCAAGSTCGIATGARIWWLDAGLFYAASDWAKLFDDTLTHYNANPDKTRPAVLNMSYGALEGSPVVMEAAIGAVIDAGIFCCFPAGNGLEDHDAVNYIPAEVDVDAVTVGGTNASDGLMWWTFWGTGYGSGVDLYAPGFALKGAHPPDIYWNVNGTSFATPFTTGVVACMLEGYTRMTSRAEVQALKTKLIANTTKGALDIPPTHSIYRGEGSVNNRLLYLDPLVAIEDIPGLIKL